MRLVYITLNRGFGELLRSTLGRNNVQVFIANSIPHVQRLCERGIDIALVDYIFGELPAVEVVRELRSSMHFKDAEVWLTAYGLTEQSAAIKKAMRNCKASRFWQQPFSPLDLLDTIKEYEKGEQFIISSVAMRMIAQIWASKTSAILSSDTSRLIFCDGALMREDPPNALETALQEQFLQFSPVSGLEGGDWVDTGKRLFHYAFQSPGSTWLEQHRNLYPVIDGFEEAFAAYTALTPLLSRLSTEKAFKQLQLHGKLLQQFYGLWMMGLIRFNKTPKEQRKKSTQPEFISSLPSSGAMRSSRNKVTAWVAQEYERLKDASPLMVLGIPESANNEMIKEAIVRMEKRYSDIMQDRTIDSDTKELAMALVQLVKKAGRQIFTLDNTEKPEHEQLLIYGQKLLLEGNWSKATKAFKKAHQLCIEDAAILSHLAWATFHNPDMDEESRKKDALESLLLAVHLDSSNVSALVFLTKMYIEMGQPESGLSPIRRAATLTPDTEVQDLRKEVEALLSKNDDSD